MQQLFVCFEKQEPLAVICSKCNEGLVPNLQAAIQEGLLDLFRDSQLEPVLHFNPNLCVHSDNKLDLIKQIVAVNAVVAVLQEQDRKIKFKKSFKRGQPPFEDRLLA